jgi:pyrroloquinoline quinone biosynthesis protein D
MTAGSGNGDSAWHPRLAARARIQFDAVANQDLLLFPEAALALNESAAAVVRLCDGERSVTAIVEEVARQFVAHDPAELADEVIDFVRQLRMRGLIE